MSRVRRTIHSVILIVVLPLLVQAQSGTGGTEASKEIPLPVQEWTLGTRSAENPTTARAAVDALPEGTSCLLHPVTGTVHRAFGGDMRIPGFDRITETNVRDAASAFLTAYRTAIGIDPERLVLQRMTHVRGRWYITWRQVHDGMDVLLSEVELRLFDTGNIAAFGAVVYPDLHAPDNALLSIADAVEAAARGLDVASSLRKRSDVSEAVQRTAILPVGDGSRIRYHRVYEIPLEERDGQRWISYVDAAGGDLLWRRQASFTAGSEVHAHGGVTLVHPHEPVLTDRAFSDMYVTIGGTRYTTDADGRIAVDIDAEQPVTALFEGPWCKVAFTDHEEGSCSDTVQPGGTLDLNWNNDNSHRFERILFYHTNYNRAYLRSIDPEFDALDFQLAVSVEFAGERPNAMSMGDQVRFIAAGHESMRMAAAPMVLYHELGHSVNIKMYEQLGVTNGMENRTCQEGMADLHASMITDHPRVGTGVFVDDETRIMRNLENDMVYPDSLTGEGHHDGQVLSGAFWDIRKSTSLEVARELSHFAKYGLPDDPNDGLAFAEWFVETLVADDDDGDLGNGTPHYREIVAAFNRHNIGTDLYMAANFRHVPVADTQDTLHPYPVRFTIKTMNLPEAGLKDVRVVYTLDDSNVEYEVDAVPAGQGEMEALIPAQPAGTMVFYYIIGTEMLSNEKVRFTADPRTQRPWLFLVGYQPVFVDPFEQDRGWTVGAAADRATRGKWERAVPEEADLRSMGGPYIQPGEDHTDNGEKCYVTGAAGGFGFMNSIPDGRTTLISPVFDLSQTRAPLLQLYYFFTTMQNPMAPDPEPAVFSIALSDDGGASWVTVFDTDRDAPAWTQLTVPIARFVNLTSAVQLRIAVDVTAGSMGMPDVMGNALVDDFAIYSAEPGSVTHASSPASMPRTTAIIETYPHPLPQHTFTTITCRLDDAGQVTLDVYDMLGRRVAGLLRAQLPAGEHSVRWDGSTMSGRRVTAGTYILSLTTSHGVATRALIIR